MSVATALKHDPLAELLDEDGLVRDFSFWTEELAHDLANEERIGVLGERHWRVIRALRSEFERVQGTPIMRSVCHQAGIDRREVNELFGYCLVAWRVAGLPNPGTEARTYLNSM